MPQDRIPVSFKSGLTNFSVSTDKAIALASKENGEALMNAAESYKQQMNKFSAGVFCFFMCFYVFNGIQASFAGLFDTKKKEPFGGGEPRQDRGVWQRNQLYVIHIDFY